MTVVGYRVGCPKCETPERDPATVRRILAALPRRQRCDPKCKGWAVFNGCEIQACDECNGARRGMDHLSDDDVAQLPEARIALAKEELDVATEAEYQRLQRTRRAKARPVEGR